jgi:hypothetical protein
MPGRTKILKNSARVINLNTLYHHYPKPLGVIYMSDRTHENPVEFERDMLANMKQQGISDDDAKYVMKMVRAVGKVTMRELDAATRESPEHLQANIFHMSVMALYNTLVTIRDDAVADYEKRKGMN